jgi:glutathione S-transferase
MYTLYDYWESGNCYKVRLLLNQLEIAYQRIPVDILSGETRTAEFLAKNANGRVPLLSTPEGRSLAESNAILYYLSKDTDMFPTDDWGRAEAMQWMFFEQYSHEPNIAVLRFWEFSGQARDHQDEIPSKLEASYKALAVMENHLLSRAWFAGNSYSIADIALYAYTHVADEGGVVLDSFPNIVAWLARVASQPGYIPIDKWLEA